MSDGYLKFANSGGGQWLTSRLGLPQPVPLRRGPGRRVRSVSVGGTGRLSAAIDAAMARLGIAEAGDGRVEGLIFDASGIDSVAASEQLHAFFHKYARSLSSQGRILVLATPPEEAETAEAAAVQRGLEGFVRSLAKEVYGSRTAQTLYVGKGAERALDSTLSFFLSDRSGYVSGQAVHLTAPVPVPVVANGPRTVVVTGAARGIGRAIAETFAKLGDKLVLIDVPGLADELDGVAAQLGGSALPQDITAADAGAALVADAKARGGYDVVVHNAGITRDRTIKKMDAARWNAVMDVNLGAPIRVTEALREGGALNAAARIVAVASLSGIAGNMGQTNYALSKAGVQGWITRLAREIASDGSTANAVAPGFIETQMTAAIPFAIRQAGRRMNSVGQGGEPVDVAETIAWLADRGSGAINGETVRVCGQSLLGA